jgi:hypothetical protein
MVVDGVSAAAYDHKPNPVIVTLPSIARHSASACETTRAEGDAHFDRSS